MMKKCKQCEEDKELEDFYQNTRKNGKKYRKSVCKKCFGKNSLKYVNKWRSKPEVRDTLKIKRKQYDQSLEAKVLKAKHARKYLEDNTEKVMLKRAETRALKSNIPFNLTIEDIVIPKICPILEIPISIGKRENYRNSPSIDKVNPKLGYIKGNVKVISSLANTMKNCASLEELEKFAKNIVNYAFNNEIVQTIEKDKSIESKDKEL